MAILLPSPSQGPAKSHHRQLPQQSPPERHRIYHVRQRFQRPAPLSRHDPRRAARLVHRHRSLSRRFRANTSRNGVAGEFRCSTSNTNNAPSCPASSAAAQTTAEPASSKHHHRIHAHSYKMNSMLRRNNPYSQTKITNVPHQSNFVALGDGVAMDMAGDSPLQWENGQVSRETNDPSQANPAPRHDNSARPRLRRLSRRMRTPPHHLQTAALPAKRHHCQKLAKRIPPQRHPLQPPRRQHLTPRRRHTKSRDAIAMVRSGKSLPVITA